MSFVWPTRAPQGGNPEPSYPANLWKTGQTTSYATGDDGYLQKGIPWPVPRFRDNGDGTATDILTGLMWAQDANLAGGTRTWQQALTYVVMMNAGIYENFGHTDWRLPNRKELHSLTDFSKTSPALPSGHPFTNVQAYYWSSTSLAVWPAEKAWYFNMNFGYTDYDFYKTNGNFCYVWPVRDISRNVLSVDFGVSGLWEYEVGNWTKINSENVEYLGVYNDTLVADFGSSWGLWEYNGTSWDRFTTADPDNTDNSMIAYDGGLAIDFGSAGLWHWDGSSWKKLNSADVEYLAVYGNKLVGDFGASWGLMEYDG